MITDGKDVSGEREATRWSVVGRPALPATVIGLGCVSLLTDVSSEAIVPLMPVFLESLHASKKFLGAVEGAADLVSSILKYISGWMADRRTKLKPLVLIGYGVSTVVRPLMGIAACPWHVLTVRVSDRIGKGVRTSPRDALIAVTSAPAIHGRAFGFNRAMDHAGAAIGTLISAGLLFFLTTQAGKTQDDAIRTIFLLAAIPGALSILALVLTPEPPHAPRATTTRGDRPAAVPAGLKPVLLAVVMFAFANATDIFLVAKLVEVGGGAGLAPLLWLTLHVVKASTATTGGRIADRFGRRNSLVIGWVVYAVTWGAVGFADSAAVLFALTAAYGLSHGLVEGAEKALIAEFSGDRRGRTFGVYNMSVGIAALASSFAFGAIWDAWGSLTAFTTSALVAALAAGVLRVLARPVRPAGRPGAAVA